MADKTTPMDGIQEIDELVLEDNQLVCVLTNKVVKATDKELTLQSMIDMMAEEYGFAPEDMERDFRVTYQEPDSEKSRAQSVDLAIFNEGKACRCCQRCKGETDGCEERRRSHARQYPDVYRL